MLIRICNSLILLLSHSFRRSVQRRPQIFSSMNERFVFLQKILHAWINKRNGILTRNANYTAISTHTYSTDSILFIYGVVFDFQLYYAKRWFTTLNWHFSNLNMCTYFLWNRNLCSFLCTVKLNIPVEWADGKGCVIKTVIK